MSAHRPVNRRSLDVWLIFRVATLFREIMHCRHLPYVIVHGTAD